MGAKQKALMFAKDRRVEVNSEVLSSMKIIKFHGILHLVEDILRYGVPACMDTGANESHHKLTKLCAKLTQRDISVFEAQTAQRLIEFLLLELAMAELDGRTIWQYCMSNAPRDAIMPETACANGQMEVEKGESKTGGTQIEVFEEDEGTIGFNFPRPAARRGYKCWNDDILEFLNDLQNDLFDEIDALDIRCEHTRIGQTFRGHPDYRGKGPWQDWVMVDWGRKHGHLPAEIWCFVDLTGLPDDFSVDFQGNRIGQGVFAVIESSYYCRNMDSNNIEINTSEMFTPIIKEVASESPEGIVVRRYYLADVEAFVSPIAVVPDIGKDDSLRYFVLTPRKDWAKGFERWIEGPFVEEEAEINTEEDKDNPPVCVPKPPKQKKATGNKKKKQKRKPQR